MAAVTVPQHHNGLEETENLSEYIKSLPITELNRYKEKLTVGGKKFADPFVLPPEKWHNDPSEWPDISFGCIYAYLVQTPGPYTPQALRSYRSTKGYGMMMEGHVRQVLHWAPDTEHYFLKAHIRPSQRTGVEYEAWTLLREDGTVLTAHCKCMAGLGEVCHHVGALLFKVEHIVASGIQRSPTSVLCKWNNRFRETVHPTRIKDVRFVKHRHGKEPRPYKRKRTDPQTSQSRFPGDLRALRAVLPRAVIFTGFAEFAETSEETESADDCGGAADLPDPLPVALVAEHKKLNAEGQQWLRECFEELCHLSDLQRKQIEEATRDQRECLAWHEQRSGRLTASVFARIVKCKSPTAATNIAQTLVEAPLVCFERRRRNPAPVRHGLEHEERARSAYVEHMQTHHANFVCSRVGLCVHRTIGYLAASPDGKVKCDCCGEGLVEIKCPYQHRDVAPQDITDTQFYMDASMHLKENHAYYFQVQAQLACAELPYCDFVCWTAKGFVVSRINVVQHFVEDHEPALHSFYKDRMLPLLLGGAQNA